MEHIKNVNKGLENKIIQLQQRLDAKVRVVLRSPLKGVDPIDLLLKG